MRNRVVRGFSLLEVLIALLVFSLGLLGLAGLMVLSVKTNHSAYLRTQASFLAQSMADRMRANTGQINAYNGTYDINTIGSGNCAGGICSPAELVTRDTQLWSNQLMQFLPGGASADIACNGATLGTPGSGTYNGLCTMTITWSESTLSRGSTGAPVDQTFAWVFQP